MITRLALSSVTQGLPKYRSMLAGNPTIYGYESIASANGSGTNAAIVFSNIPQTYKHLQLRYIGRNSITSGGRALVLVSFNSDTTYTNYRSHFITGDGTSVSAGTTQATDRTGGVVGYLANQAATSTPAAGIIDIHDYASSSKNKTIRSFTGFEDNGAGNAIVAVWSSFWMNTAAVTSITITSTTTSMEFSTDSRFALYGIKG